MKNVSGSGEVFSKISNVLFSCLTRPDFLWNFIKVTTRVTKRELPQCTVCKSVVFSMTLRYRYLIENVKQVAIKQPKQFESIRAHKHLRSFLVMAVLFLLVSLLSCFNFSGVFTRTRRLPVMRDSNKCRGNLIDHTWDQVYCRQRQSM